MESLILSIIGLTYTMSANAIEPQKLEGTKVCETGMIKVLYQQDQKRLLVKHGDQVHVMTERVVKEKKARRFENISGSLVYLHLPEKAMLLDNYEMKPVYTDCKGISS
jgi:formylmethanofuran dehydrogenase subunit D